VKESVYAWKRVCVRGRECVQTRHLRVHAHSATPHARMRVPCANRTQRTVLLDVLFEHLQRRQTRCGVRAAHTRPAPPPAKYKTHTAMHANARVSHAQDAGTALQRQAHALALPFVRPPTAQETWTAFALAP